MTAPMSKQKPSGSCRLTAQDIEIAVAHHFNYRMNLIVPNVSWGWYLRHEADMIVVRPSGLCDEIEIKTTAADIKADLKKRYDHWEDPRIARVWFAVPHWLADNSDIPPAAGIISVMRGIEVCGADHKWTWVESSSVSAMNHVEVRRSAKLRDKSSRRVVTPEQRRQLSDLAAMRIWDLKSTLARYRGLVGELRQQADGAAGKEAR